MNLSNLGDLRKFVTQTSELPDDLEIIGRAGDYDYPTDVTIKTGTYSKENSEFSGDTPCLIIECDH